jgi:hypothetical protein
LAAPTTDPAAGTLSQRDRLFLWWSAHRVLTVFLTIALLLGITAVLHRMTTGSWFSHSQTLTFTPTAPATLHETITTPEGSFGVASGPGTNGSVCIQVDPGYGNLPFAAYATEYTKPECAPLGRPYSPHIATAISLTGQGYGYGLFVAATSSEVTAVTIHTRSTAYNYTTNRYATSDYTSSPRRGIVLITYPSSDLPDSLTVTTRSGDRHTCRSSVDQSELPFFYVSC